MAVESQLSHHCHCFCWEWNAVCNSLLLLETDQHITSILFSLFHSSNQIGVKVEFTFLDRHLDLILFHFNLRSSSFTSYCPFCIAIFMFSFFFPYPFYNVCLYLTHVSVSFLFCYSSYCIYLFKTNICSFLYFIIYYFGSLRKLHLLTSGFTRIE